MKIKRCIALLCVLILSISFLCSCNKKDKENNTNNKANTHQTTKTKKPKETQPVTLDKYKQRVDLSDDGAAPNINDYNFENAYSPTGNGSSAIDDKEHTYIGGICSKCGKADKTHAHLALSTLIKNSGAKISETEYSIINNVGNSMFSIVYNEKTNEITLVANELHGGKFNRNIVLFLPNGSDSLIINYENKGKNSSHCILSAASFNSDTHIALDNFKGTEAQKTDAEAYTKDSCTVLMTVLNNYIKATNCGLTLKDLGFASYVPYGTK